MKLACLSCHRPHSSESTKLFPFKAGKPLDICNNCHKKQEQLPY